MRYSLVQKLAHIARITLVWLVAFAIVGFIRFYGMTNDVELAQRVWDADPRVYLSQLLLAGLITGILYAAVDLITDAPRYQRWAFWRLIVLKVSLHVGIIAITLIVLILSRMRLGLLNPDEVQFGWSDILSNKSYHVFIVLFFITSFIVSAYEQVSQKFGRGVLLQMMLGKYHRPQEADRIFMFVDLKSSVRLAEELGHIKYSQFLQDCYYDLNTQLDRYKARVYQYVGDQAVIHWIPEDGLEYNNCINFFFAFTERLKERGDHYRETYGVIPVFKAGAHMGKVTIAEVGVRKRSIAFHGDTVNTTSRIHDQCNNYGQRLLVSKELLSRLADPGKLRYVYIGDEILKGKHHHMEIYGVKGLAQGFTDPQALVAQSY